MRMRKAKTKTYDNSFHYSITNLYTSPVRIRRLKRNHGNAIIYIYKHSILLVEHRLITSTIIHAISLCSTLLPRL